MALETGTFVDDLVVTNPPGSDGRSQGDDHIRLIKDVLKNTFPNSTRAFYFEEVPAAKTGAYPVVVADQRKLIRGDVSGGTFSITLPMGSTVFAGYVVTVMKSDSSTTVLTVDGNGAETINGSATRILPLQFHAESYMWDGAEWKIVAQGNILTTSGDVLYADANGMQTRLAKGTNGNSLQLASGLPAWQEIPLPRGQIDGFILSNGTDADHDIDITAGACRGGADAGNINLSAITKQIDAVWALGTNAGGLDTGTVAVDTWYHVWAIERADTFVADALFSLSVSSPTLPTNYDRKRRIGSVFTDGSANIIAFTQYGDEFLWNTPLSDIDDNTPGTAAVIRQLTVPTGLKVLAILSEGVDDASPTGVDYGSLITSLDQADVAPTGTVFTTLVGPGGPAPMTGSASHLRVRTNTSGQVRSRIELSDAGINHRIVTHGWIDPRGKDA